MALPRNYSQIIHWAEKHWSSEVPELQDPAEVWAVGKLFECEVLNRPKQVARADGPAPGWPYVHFAGARLVDQSGDATHGAAESVLRSAARDLNHLRHELGNRLNWSHWEPSRPSPASSNWCISDDFSDNFCRQKSWRRQQPQCEP